MSLMLGRARRSLSAEVHQLAPRHAATRFGIVACGGLVARASVLAGSAAVELLLGDLTQY